MKVDMTNSFVAAACEVLQKELHSEVDRGPISLTTSSETSDEVTAMLAVTGQVRGMVLYGMSNSTARAMASLMIGQDCPDLDELAQSAIAELANMITGRAGVLMEAVAVEADISPPALVLGDGASISTVDLRRMIVPLSTDCGAISVHLALAEAA